MSSTESYAWLVVLGGIVCFLLAFGIGANDVANAFSTSIGSRAITIKQAVIIAGIFEFLGALLLGGTVTDAVRKNVVKYEFFKGKEDLLLLGMFSSICSSALWLFFATKYSMPVSTTHTVIGSIIGFSWVSQGFNSINWAKVTVIVIGWMLSPILSGIVSILFFLPLRSFILRKKNAYKLSLKSWPLFVFFVGFIMSLFLLIKSTGRINISKYFGKKNFGFSVLLSIGIGCVCALISYFIFISSCNGKKSIIEQFVEKTLKNEIRKNELENETNHIVEDPEVSESNNERKKGKNQKKVIPKTQNTLSKAVQNLAYGLTVDINDNLGVIESNIRKNCEKFDPKVEKAFSWLQVLTATLDIFAHGSNDVANAVAPFATMISLYVHDVASKKSPVPIWVLGMGGTGMTLGLATYGYIIMSVLGVKMAAMSSTRGYCIELGSAFIIILASHFGLPASTTHAQVGSTVGIGLLEACVKNSSLRLKDVINWKLMFITFLGWILTLVVSASVSAMIFLLLGYSPCIPNNENRKI